jgi:hypothetical protein
MSYEAWGDGPDFEDPHDALERVEFPRETRNPRKRDRDRIRFEMRRAINNRGPFLSKAGFVFDLSPRSRATFLESAGYERLHLRVCDNSPVRRADLLRTWRNKIAQARRCSKAPLP